MTRAEMRFTEFAAERLVEESGELARAWVERLSARGRTGALPALAGDERPARYRELLLRTAELVRGETAALPGAGALEELLAAEARLLDRRGRELPEALEELEALSGVLETAFQRWLVACPVPPDAGEAALVAARLGRLPMRMASVLARAYGEAQREALGQVGGGVDEGARQVERLAALVHRNLAVQRTLRRARGILEHVRDLYPAVAGGDEAPLLLPLSEVLAAVLAEVGPPAESAGVRLEPAEPLPDLRVDARRVGTVLAQTLGIAVRRARPAAPDLRVRIPLTAVAGEGSWSLLAGDAAAGAEGAARATPLSAGADEDDPALALLRRQVRALGGELEVAGSAVRLRLPRADQPGEGALPEAPDVTLA